jgi:hypothetical protein
MQQSVFVCLENDVRRDSPHVDEGGGQGGRVRGFRHHQLAS